MKDAPTALTVEQIADRLQVSETTIRRMIQRGEFKGVIHRVGGQIRFHAGLFEEWHKREARAA